MAETENREFRVMNVRTPMPLAMRMKNYKKRTGMPETALFNMSVERYLDSVEPRGDRQEKEQAV